MLLRNTRHRAFLGGLVSKMCCCMCMYGWMGEWMHGCMSVVEIMYVLASHFMFPHTCRILAYVNHTGQKFCAHRPLAPAGVTATECHVCQLRSGRVANHEK